MINPRARFSAIDGRRVTIPSFRVKAGSRVVLREKSREVARIAEALEAVERRSIPGWLELEKEKFEGVVKALPTREDLQMPISRNRDNEPQTITDASLAVVAQMPRMKRFFAGRGGLKYGFTLMQLVVWATDIFDFGCHHCVGR